jgi:hypothetical protein
MLQPYQQRQHNAVEQAQGNPILGTLGTIAGTAAGAAMGGPAGAAIGASLGSQLGNVASGAPIDPAQMAVSGVTSGLSAGSKAVGEAAKGLDAAKQSAVSAMAKSGVDSAAHKAAIEQVKQAGMKSLEAQGSILNDPFGKAARQVKSVFMADGGQVKSKKQDLKRDKDGNYILPANFDFSKLERMSENERQERANLDQQLKSKAQYKADGGQVNSPLAKFDINNLKDMKSGDRDRLLMMGLLPLLTGGNMSMMGGLGAQALNLSKGGMAGPLNGCDDPAYKACGGMAKKRY